MDNTFLTAVLAEVSREIGSRVLARVWTRDSDLFLDFNLPNGHVLRINLDPTDPGLYLSRSRQPRSRHVGGRLATFASSIRASLEGATLVEVRKHPRDRVVSFAFRTLDSTGRSSRSLLVSMTGRSTNAHLVNADDELETSLKENKAIRKIDWTAKPADLRARLSDIDENASEREYLAAFFEGDASPGPLLKREFFARSAEIGPRDAMKSILNDLAGESPRGLVYSRYPLVEFGRRPVDLRADLLLTSFELALGRGLLLHEFPSLSAAAASCYFARHRARSYLEVLNETRRHIDSETARRVAARDAMSEDLARYENPERFKRYGDLLLAHLSNLQPADGRVSVIDYFDPEQRQISIDLFEGHSPQDSAARYFTRYRKAKRAVVAIEDRLRRLNHDLEWLTELKDDLDADPSPESIQRSRERLGLTTSRTVRATKKAQSTGKRKPGKWFVSSDGLEIGVGRNDRENEALTFKVARSTDVWMHAADYPGSHVIIRNPSRGPVPHRTLIEAAQLAAYHSQARGQAKAAVHHTLRKFVSKPPRSKPGLVRLSSFKTVMVEPASALERTG